MTTKIDIRVDTRKETAHECKTHPNFKLLENIKELESDKLDEKAATVDNLQPKISEICWIC